MKFITDRFIPEGFAACARGFVVLVRPQYKDDAGLIAHEYRHVRQWLLCSLLGVPVWFLLEWAGLSVYSPLAFMSLGLHGMLYLLVPAYKLWCEVECYKLQATYSKDDRKPRFAEFISTKYGLNISVEDALKKLRKD